MAFYIYYYYSVRKLRAMRAVPQQPDADKSADIAMGTNQAYESVDARYQAGVLRGPGEGEGIYELA